MSSSLKLDWCSHEAAKFACLNWHYSKTVPMPPQNYIGVWENGVYIGCLVFSRGACLHLGDTYNLLQVEICELTRVALKKHEFPVSRMISIALKMLKARNPGLRMCVSYADENHDHKGGIYQAGNWIYVGMAKGGDRYLAPDGKEYHSRMVKESGTVRQFGKETKVWKKSECKVLAGLGKHKYLMPLDAEMRKQIEPLRKPYPKKPCAGSETVTRCPIQGREGGSIPTPALSEVVDA